MNGAVDHLIRVVVGFVLPLRDHMDVRRTGWVLLCAALLLAGCRRQQFVTSYIETINNTNRELEDEIDRLEYELKVLQQTNEDLKKQNEKNRDGRHRLATSGQ